MTAPEECGSGLVLQPAAAPSVSQGFSPSPEQGLSLSLWGTPFQVLSEGFPLCHCTSHQPALHAVTGAGAGQPHTPHDA